MPSPPFWRMPFAAAALLAIGASACHSLPPVNGPPPGSKASAALVFDPVLRASSASGVTKLCEQHLAEARRLVDRIKRLDPASGARLTFGATLGRLDDAFFAIQNGSEVPALLGVVHPDEDVREAARRCEGKAEELLTATWLDPQLARVVEAYASDSAHGEQLTPERARFLRHTLRDFRRGGVRLPPAERARLGAIDKQLTELGQGFNAALSRAPEALQLAPRQLAGLPPSFLAAHPPGPDGLVTVTTVPADYYPFVKHAVDRAAARELYVAFTNRGGEGNRRRLTRILELRHQKARLLGYASWADYAIEPRMARTVSQATAFLERLWEATEPAARQEYQALVAERERLGVEVYRKLIAPDRYYLTERLRERRCGLDSKHLAQRFEVEAVTQGLLSIAAEMYELEHHRIPAPTWHPSVRVHELRRGRQALGRIYLDLLPRPAKYPQTAMFSIRTAHRRNGVQQAPWAAVVASFPPPGAPMEHQQVATYFHEFGHVLHHLLTEAELAHFAGTNTVRDFVEVPSQTFEQLAWSRNVLERIARPGQSIDGRLHQAMLCARHVGLALHTQRQLFLGFLDLAYHSRPPGFDTTEVLREIQQQRFAFAHVPGTHFQTGFGHLVGYDAGYYGYQWALAFAHDAFDRFRAQGLFDPATVQAWRQHVLAPGGGRDERAMLRRFLGREPSEAAYIRFLAGAARADH